MGGLVPVRVRYIASGNGIAEGIKKRTSGFSANPLVLTNVFCLSNKFSKLLLYYATIHISVISY